MARSFTAGSSQSIVVPSAPSINLGTQDFTVMAWVRFPTPPPNDSMIVGKRAGGFDGDQGWELKFNDGGNETIRWDIETDVTGRQRAEGTATGITNGNWHLIGGDHTDGTPSQLQLWYDGAVIATKVANTPGTVDTATPLVIAAAYNTPNSNYLTGEIGPIFICPRLLTLAEHQMIAAGFSFRFLRPTPCFLMELINRGSPEVDIGRGGLYGTLENAPPVVPNPRIVLPRAPDIGQDLWYEFGNATIAGQSDVTATMTRARDGVATVDSQSTVSTIVTRGRDGDATIDGQSSLSAIPSVNVPVAATIDGQSTVTADLSPEAPIDAAVYGQSNIVADINIDAIVGAIPIRGQSGMVATLGALVPVATGVTGQSTVVADIAPRVPVAAQVDGQSVLTVAAKRGRTISASIGGVSSVTVDTAIEAGASAQVTANSSLSAFLSATVPLMVFAGSESGIVADASALVPVSTSVAGSSALTAQTTRARASAAALAGTSTLVVDTRALVPVATSITGISSLSAATVAIVRPVVGIDAESGIRARPTFPGVKKTITTAGVVRWLKTVGGLIRQ